MASIATIRQRHSVRRFTDRPLEPQIIEALEKLTAEARQATGLGFELVQNNPEVFNVVASFGVIKGCSTTIVLSGATPEDDVKLGYWGQHIVLAAQEMGLNTCWAAICSKSKSKATVPAGLRFRLVIAVGYGEYSGEERKTKSLEEISAIQCAEAPAWFAGAMEAAQLAPTGMNAQNFFITLLEDGKTVRAEAKKNGLRQIDLGIVKYNFEVAANELGADWHWEA